MRKVLFSEAAGLVRENKIGVIPTDTLYGLVGSALEPAVVERIFTVRNREAGKPFIVLVSSPDDLARFHVRVGADERTFLETYWPGKVSVVLPCDEERFAHLHRGTNTIAFRVPDDERLRDLLAVTGPLVAPSANPAGQPPARTIEEAETYFDDLVDFYTDGGRLDAEPSTLVTFKEGKATVLREGAVRIV